MRLVDWLVKVIFTQKKKEKGKRGGGGALLRRQCCRDNKSERRYARNGSKEAIAQAKGQRTEPNARQVEDSIPAQDLAQRDEAVVVANQSVDLAAQHRPAGHKGSQAADNACRGSNGPAQGEPVDEARNGVCRRVAHNGGHRRDEDEHKGNEPAAGDLTPGLGHRRQPSEEGLRVQHGEDDERPADEDHEDNHGAVQRRELPVRRNQVLAPFEVRIPLGARPVPRIRGHLPW